MGKEDKTRKEKAKNKDKNRRRKRSRNNPCYFPFNFFFRLLCVKTSGNEAKSVSVQTIDLFVTEGRKRTERQRKR